MAFNSRFSPCQQNPCNNFLSSFPRSWYTISVPNISPKTLGSRIRALRTQRDLSQDDLAKGLKLHRQTVSLIEQGKRDLTAVELDALARLLQVTYDEILAPEIRKSRQTEGAARFQAEKLRQLLLALLAKVGGRPNVGETVLYKLLYFCDFNHYEKTGQSITGMTYRRLQFGPVPQLNQFAPVIEQMMQRKELQKIVHEYFGNPQTRYIPLCEADPDSLNAEECATIQEVIEKLGLMNASQIEEYVHGDAPWEATEHQLPIKYELVHWRTEPYAAQTEEEMLQRAQDAGAEDILEKIEPMTNEEIAYYESLPDRRHAK